MSTSSHALGLIPVAALVALLAAGSFAVASPKLDGSLDQAKELALDAVHQGASAIADQTNRGEAKRIVRKDAPILRTGPMPRARPVPPPRSPLPVRSVGGQSVPDFVALQDDVDEKRHSGRLPPR